MYRSPIGSAGRGPQRSWRVTDFDNWERAACGRLLAEYEPELKRRRATPQQKPPGPPRPEGPAPAT